MRSRMLAEWVGVTVTACGLVALLLWAGATAGADRLIYDGLMQARRHAPSDRILLVTIDDRSLNQVGAWPWARATHARLLDRLTAAAPAAIGYDVMFLEPQPDDPVLTRALAASGRTVLPVAALSPGDDGRAVRVLRPVEPLARAAARLGHVELAPDADGVVRSASSAIAVQGRCWRALSLSLLDVASGAPGMGDPACRAMAATSGRIDGLISSPRPIAFAGPAGAFRTVSASAVLAGEVPEAFVRDKLVLVGADALGLGDRHATATSAAQGAMAGVEVQANLLDAALQGRSLAPLSPLLALFVSMAPVAALCLLLPRLNPASSLIAAAGSIVLALAGCGVLFLGSVWVAPLSTAAGLAVVYPLWSWRRLAAASRALAEEIARLPKPVSDPSPPPLREAFGRQLESLGRAADLLRDLSRRLEDTLQSLPDATVVIDARGRIVLANHHARAFAGSADTDLIGTAVETWLAAQFPPPQVGAALGRLESGEPSTVLRSARGVDYEAARAPIVSEAGAVEGAILRLHDISLVQRAARQREEVIQLLTHDLRAPLASILALLSQAPASAGRADDRVATYARRALALAEGYVQLARAESKAMNTEPLDLADLAVEAADELWPQASAKGVTLRSGPTGAPACIRGDRSLVMRALVNVLDNAIKVSTAGQAVCIGVDRLGPAAACVIDDEGPGLAEGEAERLFQPFQMGGQGGAKKAGVGLGLATVQMVMHRHGGTARCEARAKGARFVLEFPLAPEEEAPVDPQGATSSDGERKSL